MGWFYRGKVYGVYDAAFMFIINYSQLLSFDINNATTENNLLNSRFKIKLLLININI